jgi:ABC-type glutathione transport system ATPase component
VEQNLAVPLTLDLEPMAEAIRASVAELASAVGLSRDVLDGPLHELPASVRTRIRLGRALALRPSILILEHPTVDLSAPDARSLAVTIRQVASARSLCVLVVSSDAEFCSGAATRRLTWKAADGTLTEAVGWRRWFGG